MRRLFVVNVKRIPTLRIFQITFSSQLGLKTIAALGSEYFNKHAPFPFFCRQLICARSSKAGVTIRRLVIGFVVRAEHRVRELDLQLTTQLEAPTVSCEQKIHWTAVDLAPVSTFQFSGFTKRRAGSNNAWSFKTQNREGKRDRNVQRQTLS